MSNRSSLLLLIHGALMDRRSMLTLVPHLPASHLFLCVDLAGHGTRETEHLHLSNMSPHHLAKDLLDIHPIREIVTTIPIQLIGHSLGGLVAMEVIKLLIDRGTTRLASLTLGDPPLFIDLNTPSQESAALNLRKNPIGKRIAKDCFFDFEYANPASGSQSIYLNRLIELTAILPIHLFHGLLPWHQRDDGSSDCGTFLSVDNIDITKKRSDKINFHPISDAGHFVFHTKQGINQLANCLG